MRVQILLNGRHFLSVVIVSDTLYLRENSDSSDPSVTSLIMNTGCRVTTTKSGHSLKIYIYEIYIYEIYIYEIWLSLNLTSAQIYKDFKNTFICKSIASSTGEKTKISYSSVVFPDKSVWANWALSEGKINRKALTLEHIIFGDVAILLRGSAAKMRTRPRQENEAVLNAWVNTSNLKLVKPTKEKLHMASPVVAHSVFLLWLVSISDEGSFPEITLSDASKLASTLYIYFTQ